MRQQRFNFNKLQKRFEQAKPDLAIEIARTAESQFKDNFRQGGFVDAVLEKWEPRKKEDEGRAILVKSGKLKRSIKAEPGSDFQKITISSDVIYAERHNSGLKGMPKRKFIGESKVLNIKIKTIIKKAMDRVFS